jgi:hypothetical protein
MIRLIERICWFLRLAYRPHPFCLPNTPPDLRRPLSAASAWDMAGVLSACPKE